MSRKKSKKAAKAQDREVPTTSVPVNGSQSNAKVTKSKTKKKQRAAAAAAAAAPALPQGHSAQLPPESFAAAHPVSLEQLFPQQTQYMPASQLMVTQSWHGFPNPQAHPDQAGGESGRSNAAGSQDLGGADMLRRRHGRRVRDPVISAPSAASGGVPSPTPEYLSLASLPPFRIPNPKPLLIVLDLNGTLLYRPSRNPKAFVARPHARTFIDYLLSRFWVAVWSSAKPDNVGAMIDNLVSEKKQRERLVAVWGRDRFGLTGADYARRVQVYKRLTRLWSDPAVAASYPSYPNPAAERWDQSNTILVDDSVEKARSEPYNLVCVPEFSGNMEETPEVLPQVHDYLNELCFQRDVSTFMRTNPFVLRPEGQEPHFYV